MEVAVLDRTGKDTGRKAKLAKEVFGIEPNAHAIYLDVKQHLANKRQGTHKAKERAEIAGSTRKIKKNKKVLVPPVQGVSKTHCLEEEAVCSVPNHGTTVKKSIKKSSDWLVNRP